MQYEELLKLMDEGSIPDASYWYHSAGRNMPGTTLEEEWETIARVLIRDI